MYYAEYDDFEPECEFSEKFWLWVNENKYLDDITEDYDKEVDGLRQDFIEYLELAGSRDPYYIKRIK